MLKRLLLFLCICAGLNSQSQTDSTSYQEELPPALGEAFRPTIGFGTGMLSFYGDLYKNHLQSPWNSRLAYDLTVSQPLSKSLYLNFYVMFGKLGANERSSIRNENFESEIRLGGLNLMYDFSNFFPVKKYRCRPWIATGFEGFEFLSKTDLYDRYGNKYYYWYDGSIKNMAEGSPGSQNAVNLVRDYTYESDIRQLNKDGFGKYAERSWAVPVGLGFLLHLNKKVDFKMGTTVHLTFTDYIDGISGKSKGDRKGTNGNDKFIMTSFSLHYNLAPDQNDTTPHFKPNFKDVDFFAIDAEDEDGDGVRDFYDESHRTPEGVPVDAKGRPFDTDGDWIPDYRDDEASTASNTLANPKGVAITDPMAQAWYDSYFDSTGVNVKVVNVDSIAMAARGIKVKSLDRKYFTVELGRFKGGIPSFVMEYLLSVNDVASLEEGDSIVMYNAGSYEEIGEAIKRKNEFVAAGVDDAKIAYFLRDSYVVLSDEEALKEFKLQDGLIKKAATEDSIRLVAIYGVGHVPKDSLQNVVNHTTNNHVKDTTAATNIVHYTANPLKDSTAHVIHTNPVKDTTTAVVNHTTNTVKDTATTVVNHTTNPVKDTAATVVNHTTNPVKDTATTVVNHTTNPVKDTTATVVNHTINPVKDTATTIVNHTTNPVKDTASAAVKPPVNDALMGIVYRVQLGAYKNKLSPGMFKNAGKIVELRTPDGYYKYVTIGYKSIEDAAKHRANLLLEGYPDAFISAYKDGKRISLAQAGAVFENKQDAKNEVLSETKNLVNAFDKTLVSYKIQLGVVRTEGSDPEFTEKMKGLSNVDKQTTITGLLRYTVGDYRTYNEAVKMKNTLLQKGFTDAFVIATFKGDLISIQEANELTK